MQVFVRSFGCSANTADSEALMGALAAAGFGLADSEASAQVVVYNSCAVKGPTENRIIDALKRIPASKKVIVAGCLPLISFERLLREINFDGVVGPAAGNMIVDVVQRVLDGEKVVELEKAKTAMPELDLPRVPVNPVISVVPVNYGCLGSCAYCCVVHARGHLRSYSISQIVNRVRSDGANGVKEFWITSQDTACYGREKGTNLAELLKAVCAIEADFRVRVGMMTPNFVKPFLEDLLEAFGSKKVYKFVHLPVQSGDNQVLAQMRRFYTAEDFKKLIATFRETFPNVTLSTDVICGFPGESKEAFGNTLRIVRDVQPDIVNVSKFFARPKTIALKMQDLAVPKAEISRRSAEMAKVAKQIALERNQRWLDWTGEILVDEKGKVSGSWVGRNFAYKPIAVKSEKNLIGKKVNVRVTKAFSTHLVAAMQQ